MSYHTNGIASEGGTPCLTAMSAGPRCDLVPHGAAQDEEAQQSPLMLGCLRLMALASGHRHQDRQKNTPQHRRMEKRPSLRDASPCGDAFATCPRRAPLPYGVAARIAALLSWHRLNTEVCLQIFHRRQRLAPLHPAGPGGPALARQRDSGHHQASGVVSHPTYRQPVRPQNTHWPPTVCLKREIKSGLMTLQGGATVKFITN